MKTGTSITILCLSVVLAFSLGFWSGGLVSETADPNVLQIGGERIPIPPGCMVEVEYQDAGGTEPVIMQSSRGGARAADLSTLAAGDWKTAFAPGEPRLDLDGQAGGIEAASYAAAGLASRGPVIVAVLGALCILGGVVCAVWWDRRTGIIVALAGLGLVAVGVMFERYPWMSLVLPAVALAGLAWFLWRNREASRRQAALEGIVRGVEAADAKAAETVKAKIAAQDASAGGVIKSVVRKIKTRAGIGGKVDAAAAGGST